MKEHKRIIEIDILKGIAILYVILAHAVIVYPVDLHEIYWCKTLYDLVRTTHMPLFFLLSGFCFSYRGDYPQYLKKKSYRILIPYLVFSLVDCVPRALLSSLFNRSRNIEDSIVNLLLYGGAKWFLYSLFLIFLVFPVISHLVSKKKSIYWVVLVTTLILKFIPNIPEEFLLRRTLYHLLYFVVGYGMKIYRFSISDVTDKLRKQKILTLAIAGILFCIMLYLVPYYAVEDNQALGVPLAAMGIVFSFCITALIKESKIGKLFSEFGTFSLQLYLFNSYFLGISRTMVVNILKIHNPVVIIGCNVLITLFVSYAFIKYIINRFKLTKLLTGIV